MARVLTLIMASFLGFSSAYGQPEHDRKMARGTIKQGMGAYYKTDVSLGSLPYGENARVQFRLVNQSGSQLEFAEVETSCSCATFNVPAGSLPIGKEVVVDATIRVPKHASSAKQKFRATVKSSSGELPVVVNCEYSIAGLLAFDRDRFMAEYDLKSKEPPRPVRIPIIATKPVDLGNVQAAGLGGLAATQCRVVSVDGEAYVECIFDRDSLTKAGLAGEIEIHDPTLQRSAKLACLIGVTADYDIAPKHLSVTWNATRNCYEGRAIFRLLDDEAQGKESMKLRASLLGLPGKVVVAETKLTANKQIYRLEVSVFPKGRKPFDPDDAPSSGRWRFEIDQRSFSVPTGLTCFSN